ncbi:acylphosphatase [Marinobacterium sp. YM272]|uniref:acylphosphatase n=1 Tax=Marinobacterium sp. YM272 TaxID=3421654 RepID=UPI003D7F2CEB
MAELCIHLVVRGRVQGVSFRRFVEEQAIASAVSGWVRNCGDGSVEAMLCGEAKAVHHVETWLNRGPELSRVDSVEAQELPMKQYEGFTIRRDGE